LKAVKVLREEQVQGQVLDHLGLIAAVIDKTGLIEKIDERLPVSAENGAKITMGQRVGAMIMNGLGFMDDRLYMFADFLQNKPVDRLFGQGITADMFNDDALGRCLDAIYKFGVTPLFAELAFDIGTQFGLLGKTARFDTTSLTVFGDFKEKEEKKEVAASTETAEEQPAKTEQKEQPFTITHGYSKDGRPDLKQMVLNLATTGAGSFPIWMESHSGNAADKTILQEAAVRMQKFCGQLDAASAFLCVGDSAMYEKCVAESTEGLLWLSRVPHSIKKAKEVLQKSDTDLNWIQLENGYKIYPCKSSYENVAQRWILVFSEQAYKREIETLDRNVVKEKTWITKALWHFGNQVFNCEKDAEKALKPFHKKVKYHDIVHTIEIVEKHAGKGRPKNGVVAKTVGYQIKCVLNQNEEEIIGYRLQKGRFILATNQLDNTVLSDQDMLTEYKEQTKTEAAFRFIKGNAMEVSSVFLKNESRVQAFMMVMTLCLMVYSLGELFVRQALAEHNQTIPNQLKKPTKMPTMAWVCRLFHGIQVLHVQFEGYLQQIVINLKEVTKQLISYFGRRAQQIYGLKTP
jgi:transposase